MKRLTFLFAVLFLLATAFGQAVGDKYHLTRPGLQIPGHPALGDHTVSIKFDDNAVAEIQTVDTKSGWYQVKVGSDVAWVIQKYLGEKVVPTVTHDPISGVVVGAWNLEWLEDGKSRGFPENGNGGPSYGPRTEEDYDAIAEVINTQLKAAALVLEEVAAHEQDGVMKSDELDRLRTHLGNNYVYVVGQSGGSQHVAILWDKTKLRLNNSFEIQFPEEPPVQESSVFARNPLVAHFTVLNNGQDGQLNDFALVGLHLASGQQKNKNHDRAFAEITQKLADLINEGEYIPKGENDVILAGDLNLDFFDKSKEAPLQVVKPLGKLDILADANSPATRCAGVPLAPKSRIDYVIVTDEMRAPGKEIGGPLATSHQELANSQWDHWREHFSDHFPVTVNVQIMKDDD